MFCPTTSLRTGQHEVTSRDIRALPRVPFRRLYTDVAAFCGTGRHREWPIPKPCAAVRFCPGAHRSCRSVSGRPAESRPAGASTLKACPTIRPTSWRSRRFIQRESKRLHHRHSRCAELASRRCNRAVVQREVGKHVNGLDDVADQRPENSPENVNLIGPTCSRWGQMSRAHPFASDLNRSPTQASRRLRRKLILLAGAAALVNLTLGARLARCPIR